MISKNKYLVKYKIYDEKFEIDLIGSSKKDVIDSLTTFFINLLGSKKAITITSIELMEDNEY